MRPLTVRRSQIFMLVAVIALTLALLTGGGVAYGLVMQMSADQLTDTAATIVVAQATATHSYWTNPGGATWATKGTIVTDVRLAVYEVLKGGARRTMTITVPGGTVGKASMPVEDAPRFVPGLTYVVFLAANGQVIAWREGQPQVVGDRVPALGVSLAGLKADVARRVGRQAEVLRPWSGYAPAAPVAPSEFVAPADAAAASGSTAVAAPASAGTGVGGGVAPAGARLTAPPAPPAPAGVQPRAVSTLFSDDFESQTMDKWTLQYSTPVHMNEGYFSNDYWVDDQNNTYWWAYSAAQHAYMYIAPQWFWEHQFAYGGQYANSDNTWMISKNPINLSGYSHGVLNFDLWLDTAGPGDQLGVWFSTDGSNFSGPYWYEQEGSLADPPYFASKSIDLTAVPTPGGTTNFCGQSQVWIAFHFQSDGSGTGMGGCVDNVALEASNAPIPVISDISPGSAPSGTYLQPTRNQSRVTISGSGFGSAQGRIAFYYQDGEPLITGIVRSWNNTQVVCDVPIGTINGYPGSAGSGPVCVVTAANVWSGGFSFDVPYAYGNQDWEASLCNYRVNMDGGQEAAVDAAAQSWNNVGTAMQFQNIGACTTTPVGTGSSTHMPRDGHNDMCFDSLPFPGVIAAAWPFAVNGRVLETDICFNTTGNFSWGNAAVNSSLMDIQTIAVHETGHWLNLRDLYGPGDTGRVMYGFCGEGVVKRALTSGEVAGIQWIYTGHSTDTLAPVTQAKSLTVVRGKTAKIRFAVNDPAPSIGVAAAQVVIKSRSGKIVKKTSATVYTRFWYTWPFRCRLAKGRYSINVTATDAAGFAQSKIIKGYLTVK